MAFPPETLTKAVWGKIIGDLSNHFGEDASLDAETVAKVLAYHQANASDVSDQRAAMKWTSDVAFSRLTEGERFIDKHGSCAAEVWTNPKVKLKSNCQACHTTMHTDGSTDADVSFLTKDQQASCNELGSFGVFLNGMF
ncbi:MAG: cytochrome C [Magnetovibrio sp.]|nr:cytochrome C [Magnetovibrio sp.]